MKGTWFRSTLAPKPKIQKSGVSEMCSVDEVIKYICVQEEIEYLKPEKQRFQGSCAALCTEAVPEKGFFIFYISYVMTVLQSTL